MNTRHFRSTLPETRHNPFHIKSSRGQHSSIHGHFQHNQAILPNKPLDLVVTVTPVYNIHMPLDGKIVSFRERCYALYIEITNITRCK